MTPHALSTAVVGPGAIGLCALTALADKGHDVIACARTGFDRVSYRGPDGERTHEVLVLTDPAGVATPVDLVVLATKAHQVAAAGPWLRALAGPETVVAVLQNGVDHRERVAPFLESAAVAPVVVNLPASRGGPGVVELEGSALLTVADDPAGRLVAEAFGDSFIGVRLVEDWRSAAWVKLLINSAVGIIGVLGRVSNGALADPEVADLAHALLEEAALVGRAEGAVLPDDIADMLIRRVVSRSSVHVSSIVADRLAGHPTEWVARNRIVVDLAERHGIEVPLNRAGTTLIRLGEPSDRR